MAPLHPVHPPSRKLFYIVYCIIYCTIYIVQYIGLGTEAEIQLPLKRVLQIPASLP